MSRQATNRKPRADADSGEVVTLSRRHESVIVALLAHPKLKDAAREAGVSESTVWRLMQREEFQRRYKEAQDKALDGALGALQGAAASAIDALKGCLDSRNESARVAAARVILDFTLRTRDQFDYAARIKQLEATIKAREEADRRRAEKGEDEEDEG
jgi:hypothetical protein